MTPRCPHCESPIRDRSQAICPGCGKAIPAAVVVGRYSALSLCIMFGWPLAAGLIGVWYASTLRMDSFTWAVFWVLFGLLVTFNTLGMLSRVMSRRRGGDVGERPGVLAALTAFRIIVILLILAFVLLPAILIGACLMMFT